MFDRTCPQKSSPKAPRSMLSCDLLAVKDQCKSKSRFIKSQFGDIDPKLNHFFAKACCPRCLRSIEEGDSTNPKLMMIIEIIGKTSNFLATICAQQHPPTNLKVLKNLSSRASGPATSTCMSSRREPKSRFIKGRFGDIGLKLTRPCFHLFAESLLPKLPSIN